MKFDDQAEFVRILNGLAEMKTGAKLTTQSIDLYWQCLHREWTIEEFRAAAEHLAKAFQWMPNPYHFEQLRRAGELTAGEAWELVLSGARLRPGSRAERAARIVGGQWHIRHANVERDLPHIQRRFLEAYAELTDVDEVRARLPEIVAPEYRLALSGPAPLSRVTPQLEHRPAGPQPAAPRRAAAPAAAQPKPESPPAKKSAVSVRRKVEKLVAIGMSDDDIAKVISEPVARVRELRRASSSQEVA